MKKSNDLKQLRASKLDAQIAIADTAEARAEGQRALNADEETRFDALQSEIESLSAQIVRAEKFEENRKAAAAGAGVIVGAPAIIGSKKEERFSLVEMFRAAATPGAVQRDAEQKYLDQGESELNAMGKGNAVGKRIALPSNLLYQRSQSVTGDAGAKGGKLVASTPSEVMPLLPSLTLKDMGAKVYDNLTGDYPLISGDAFNFSYVTENGTAGESDVSFDGPILKPKRLSGVVLISNQWLAQTNANNEANLYDLIGNGINSAMVKAAIAGATNGPSGLYDTIGNVQAGAAGAPTWDDVVGLETLIKSANATKDKLYYLSDPALMGKLKTTKKDAGSGIYLVGENGLLNGKNYLDTTLAATLDAGASHPLIYGDFSQMGIGFWSGVQFTIDPYTKVAEGYTRVVFNIYNDVQLANANAFAIRKNFTV